MLGRSMVSSRYDFTLRFTNGDRLGCCKRDQLRIRFHQFAGSLDFLA